MSQLQQGPCQVPASSKCTVYSFFPALASSCVSLNPEVADRLRPLAGSGQVRIVLMRLEHTICS
jgi:hypothetical protein